MIHGTLVILAAGAFISSAQAQCNPDLFCFNCTGTDPNQQCTSCRNGYVLTNDPLPKCQACAKNCETYGCTNNGPGKCDRCNIIYGLTPTNTCDACHQNCNGSIGCDFNGTCLQCNRGYGLTINNTCDLCANDCDNTVGCMTAGKCDKCRLGTGLTANSTCGLCDRNCDTTVGCNVNGTCLRCIEGYGLTPAMTCEQIRPTSTTQDTILSTAAASTIMDTTVAMLTAAPLTISYSILSTTTYSSPTISVSNNGADVSTISNPSVTPSSYSSPTVVLPTNDTVESTISNSTVSPPSDSSLTIGSLTNGTFQSTISNSTGSISPVVTPTTLSVTATLPGVNSGGSPALSITATITNDYFSFVSDWSAGNTPDRLNASSTLGLPDVYLYPTYGPLAGGTVVTIVPNWKSQNILIGAVYVGSNLRATYVQTSGQNVSVKTPSSNDTSLVNQPLPIILEISLDARHINITTGKNFTYKPNPEIFDINPKLIPVSGGIPLNISGTNLGSAAHPYILAVTVVQRGNSSAEINETTALCSLPNEDGNEMNCTSPYIYIPFDFLRYMSGAVLKSNGLKEDGILLRISKSSDSGIRTKRSSDVSTNQRHTSPNNQDQLTIYMNAVFDDSQIPLNANGRTRLYYPASCQNKINFNIDATDSIIIQGTNMNQYYSQSEYTVRIGNGSCDVLTLTDNALTCSPPKVKPQQTDTDKLYCSENFAINVIIKSSSYLCSCLSYSDDGQKNFIIIVVTTVGSSLIIIAVIIIVSIIITRKPKSATPSTHESVPNPLLERRGFAIAFRQPHDIASLASNDFGSIAFRGGLNYDTRIDSSDGGYVSWSKLNRPRFHQYLTSANENDFKSNQTLETLIE